MESEKGIATISENSSQEDTYKLGFKLGKAGRSLLSEWGFRRGKDGICPRICSRSWNHGHGQQPHLYDCPIL